MRNIKEEIISILIASLLLFGSILIAESKGVTGSAVLTAAHAILIVFTIVERDKTVSACRAGFCTDSHNIYIVRKAQKSLTAFTLKVKFSF